MFTVYQTEAMMLQVFEERLRHAELRRTRDTALHRSRVRSTFRRTIEEGLRHGIEPHEVEREFTTTLQQVTSR